MSDDNNIVRFGSVQGGKPEQPAEDTLPVNSYVITDHDHQEWYGDGFLVFTAHHIAIMRDFNNGHGPVPVTVIPLTRVRGAELIEPEIEEDQSALPF